MATVKKLNTSYTIDTTDVVITGNLTVQGTQASVETTNTVITDKVITLNKGETGSGVGPAGTGEAGIEINRGSLTTVKFVWNEPLDTWQLSNALGYSANVLTSTSGSTALTAIIQDLTPELGGNLNTGVYTIVGGSGSIKFDGNLQLSHQPRPTTFTANTVTLYAQSPEIGGTGLFVYNNTSQNEELITKNRAIIYSIIF